jgi:fermentation-respiration switch protein FrsA (DUF1100 family)
MTIAGTLLMKALRIGAASYAGLFLVVFVSQRRYVYYPDRDVALTPAAAHLPYEEVLLSTGDGQRLGAWFIPAAASNRLDLTLLFCHGNGGNISHSVGSAETFHKLGFDVLLFDYRGYGTSTGKPSETGTYRDADAAWDYLTVKRGIPPGRIVLFGRSLGGAIAAELAARVKPHTLVLESSFTRAADMAAQMFPLLPSRLLCRFGYNTAASVRKVTCPVIVAHGPADEMIPFRMGEKIFAQAPEPKRFIAFRGAHNDGGMDVDADYRHDFMLSFQ